MSRASQTLGLYVPGGSPVHRARASVKLFGLLLLGLAVTIPPPTWWLLGSLGALLVGLFLLAGLGWSRLGRQLWALRWLIVVVFASQLVFLSVGVALVNVSRMLLMIMLAAFVTLTTRTREILAALEHGFGPLRRIGANPARLSLLLSMTIRTVPIVAGLAEQIRDAQRARGGRFSIRAFIVPLLVGSLRQADDLADALAARGLTE